MKWVRKRWQKFFISCLLLVFLSVGGIALWAGSEIASPARRALMDYHREMLDHQSRYGIRVVDFTANDGTPCLIVTPAGSVSERGEKIRQQLVERGLTLFQFGQIHGTLLLTHGRKGRKEDYLSIAERLCAVGFRCVIPDLPGHGDHPGNIATYGVREAGLPSRILDEAATKFGFEQQPAGIMGMSMGGSVAVHAASEPNAPWKALVVVASFDSFPAIIEGQATRFSGIAIGPRWAEATAAIYHWKSGIRLEDIQPARRASSIHIPTMIAHGTADPVVPLESGRRLFASLPVDTPKKWVEIPGAGHDNVLVTSYPIYADIAEWMLRYVAASP